MSDSASDTVLNSMSLAWALESGRLREGGKLRVRAAGPGNKAEVIFKKPLFNVPGCSELHLHHASGIIVEIESKTVELPWGDIVECELVF